MTDFSSYGVAVPKILLPKKIDLQKWAVIACDQYTQDRAYWKILRYIAFHTKRKNDFFSYKIKPARIPYPL